MSILFKGNLEEGNYTLIKSTDGWVLKGETSYVGFDSTDRPHGEWIKHEERTETNGKFIDFFPAEYECSNCGLREAHYFINSKPHNFCPNCGAKMDGERKESE